MPVFRYTAYNAGGKEIAGAIEAASSREAAFKLRKDGVFVKSLDALEPSVAKAAKAGFKDVAVFTAQLSALLGSGASLHEALTLLLDETDNRRLRQVIFEMREDISSGVSLSSALRRHPKVFKTVYVSAVEAGEATGSLAASLSRLSEYLEAGRRIRDTLKTALLYPAFISAAGAGVLLFLFIFVLPKMLGIFEETGQPLPLLTRVFLHSGWFLGRYWHVIAVFCAAMVFAARKAASTSKGRAFRDSMVLRLPYAGRLVRKYLAAELAWTLGTLLSGGVPILKALDMSREALGSNSVFKDALSRVACSVSEGVALSSAMRVTGGVFPAVLIHFIAMGETAGEVHKLLLVAARQYEREFQTSMERGLSVLEPAIVLVMGAAVGLIVLSVLVPVLDISMAVK